MPYNKLQLLQIEARKLGLATQGTEKDLRRRLKSYYDRHGHLKPVARAQPRKPFSPRRYVTDLYAHRLRRAAQPRRQHSYDEYIRKQPDYKKAAQRRKEAEKRWEAERRRRYQRVHLPPRHGDHPRKDHYREAAKHNHKHNYAHAHPHKDHYYGPSESRRDQLLRTCGPQCFADTARTVPICPYCDSHSCKCRPECDALKYAADRNIDRSRMLHYGKMLKCGWALPPPQYDDHRPKSAHRSKSGSRRRSRGRSSKFDNLIGVTFRAPDGNTHKILGISSDGLNVNTKSSNGSSYKVPLKYVLQILIK